MSCNFISTFMKPVYDFFPSIKSIKFDIKMTMNLKLFLSHDFIACSDLLVSFLVDFPAE